MRLFLLLTTGLFLSSAVVADDNTTDVPLSHRIYRTVDRFDARGWFDRPLSQIRPYTRLQAAGLLLQVLQRKEAGASVSRTEQGILDRHRGEFAIELKQLGYEAGSVSGGTGVFRRLASGGHLFAWQDTAATLVMDPLFRERLILIRGEGRAKETVSQTYVGGIVRGTFRDRFGFRVRHFEAREWSTRPRTSRADILARPIEVVQFKNKTVDFREATFQLVWGTPWFDLDAGKGSLDWGPGRTGNLFLTDGAPSFGMVRFRTAYGRVRFSHVVGFLEARKGLIDSSRTMVDNGYVRTFPRSRALSAHRVEIELSKRVSLGIQEAVIYGDRELEFLYLPPVSVLTAAQMSVGDRDNLVMGLDFSVRAAEGFQTYAALFMDDLRKFSPSAFSNKFAFQVGLFWVDPFGLRDTDFRAEFVHVEPFVYSHRFDINTYEHFDALLGYPTGPNSDRIWAQMIHRLSPSISFSVRLDRERQGENVLNPDGTLTNVGGDAQQGRRPGDPTVRDFMSGTVEKHTRLGLEAVFEPIRDLILSLDYKMRRATNVILPDGNRGDGLSHTWMFTADFNFF